MPATSKAQQRFMGLVKAYQDGDVPASKVSKAVKDAAKSMGEKEVDKSPYEKASSSQSCNSSGKSTLAETPAVDGVVNGGGRASHVKGWLARRTHSAR